MSRYFSLDRGFLDDRLHRDIPADAAPISDDDYQALLDGQTSGRAIVIGDDGRPRAVAPPAPSIGDRRAVAIAAVKREAERRILAVAPLWQQINDAADQARTGSISLDAAARRTAIDRLRAASNALEMTIAGMNARAIAALDIAAPHHWTS